MRIYGSLVFSLSDMPMGRWIWGDSFFGFGSRQKAGLYVLSILPQRLQRLKLVNIWIKL